MRNIFQTIFGATKLPQVEPMCPPDTRIYSIGDIHGCEDLLRQLQALIIEDSSDYTGHKKIIYLGDYIDRGEHSKQVIELLVEHPLTGFESIYLRGNHEQSLLDFLVEPDIGRSWFNYGGLQTLVSYGVKFSKIPTSKDDLKALQSDLKDKIPSNHLAFYKNTDFYHESGHYYFVHAGVKPGLSLDKQQASSQLWIRDEFIGHTKPFEKIIVHGHTCSEQAEFKINRIGIDTCAYASGKLTCLVLEHESQRIIQAST